MVLFPLPPFPRPSRLNQVIPQFLLRLFDTSLVVSYESWKTARERRGRVTKVHGEGDEGKAHLSTHAC